MRGLESIDVGEAIEARCREAKPFIVDAIAQRDKLAGATVTHQ